ncbi:MAG: DUF5686 family protein [Mangrovibacterium sp.]
MKMPLNKRFLLCFTCSILLTVMMLISGITSGQTFSISGQITDRDTGLPVPYATIVFENTMTGTISNTDGYFRLETNEPGSMLRISAVGYIMQRIPTENISGEPLNIRMKEEVISIAEVEVTPGENPAHRILQLIIDHKAENDPAYFPDWQSRLYSKIEFDLKNVKKPKKEDSKFWQQAGFIFEYMDTLETGKTFLPIFITETHSDYYQMQDGKSYERIRANKMSGVQTGSVAEFTGKLYTDINPYENFFRMSNIGLISPLNNQGLMHYRYFLRDSTQINGKKIYELSFFPKVEQSPAFRGKFWVDSSNWALRRIEMRLSAQANVNFVNDLVYEKDYVFQNHKYIPYKEALWIDFNIQKKDKGKLLGVIGRKTLVYEDFKFTPAPEKIKRQKREISVAPDAFAYEELYWDSIRPVGLEEREAAIYGMVDSLKNVPIVRTIFDYVEMFLFGYKDFGKVELGPYFYMYSYNEIEGHRFRFGGRTTTAFHEKLRLNGYLAYGIRDGVFKYSGGFEYFFNKEKQFSVEARYKHDYELFGRGENAFAEDNILMAMLAKDPLKKLNMFNRLSFQADKEWIHGLSNTQQISTTRIKSGPYIPFTDREGNQTGSIRNTAISLNTRLAPRERTVTGAYEKRSLGSTLPVVDLKASAGIKGLLSGDYDYFRLHTDIYDKLPLYPIGYTTYLLQAGRVWGDVPFPLMKIHEGNETYASDKFAFNLMNYQEYVSDQYLGIALEHHFQGFFFNRIPLMKRLQFREVIGGRWLIGDMDPSKHDQLVFPAGMSSLKGEAYGEVSVGIENILKILRVDAVWRLTGHSQVDYDQFGVLFSLQFDF